MSAVLARWDARLAALTLLLIIGCCAGAGFLAEDPETQRPWVGATPPGSRHPAVAATQTFAVGQPAGPTLDQRLDLEVYRTQWSRYRLALRRGVVAITGPDAAALTQLDLGAEHGRTAQLLFPDAREPVAAPPVLVTAGAPPPPGLFTEGWRVAYVRIAVQRQVERWQVTVTAGVVTALTCDGQPVAKAILRGDDILRCSVDGRERTVFHLLGTDQLGRDQLARLLHGGQISLLVALVATAVAMLIGVLYGAIAGWRGGHGDAAMMAAVDVMSCLPFLLLIIVLMAVLGRSLHWFFLTLGAVSWLTTARLVRAQVMTLMATDWVLAARASGLPPARIILRHLIPACAGVIAAAAILTVPLVIMEESLLSFVGLGIQSAEGKAIDSWGTLIAQGMAGLGPGGERVWLLATPCLAMVATLLCCGVLGDALRRAAEPRR